MLKALAGAGLIACLTIGSANALSLTTGFSSGGDGFSGMAFDVLIGPQDVTMTALGANVQDDPGVSVYLRLGTHVGNTNSAAGWTEIFSDAGFIGSGIGVETFIDVTDSALLAGQTYGIAVFIVDRIEGPAGTGLGNTAAANADLSILEGSGIIDGSFGSEFASASVDEPFVVQSTIYYDLETVPAPAPLALLASAVVVTGFVARRRSR